MLALRNQKIIEKIVETADGSVFRLYFLAFEKDGKIKGRLLKAVLISSPKPDSEKVILLENIKKGFANFEISDDKIVSNIISPYSSILHWKGSKPRAPAFSI